MKIGIASKLITTYFIIILVTVMSCGFCLYVVSVNLRVNRQLRDVALPSMENIKAMRALMQDVKKLTGSWVYAANNKDQERLKLTLNADYCHIDSNLQANSKSWTSEKESDLFRQIGYANEKIVDSTKQIMALLNTNEAYANDLYAEKAAALNDTVSKLVTANEKLYIKLINTEERNLARQQSAVSNLLDSLYIVVLLTVVVVVVVSYFSLRYSQKNIINPVIALSKTILNMAAGQVERVDKIDRTDEIGQMQNAVFKMIEGIIEKINFAEQIGKGNYDSDFALLSEKDTLGKALQTMRDDLKLSNKILAEQDKRLIDAQKLARIGNYFYNIETGEFQSSPTLDDILGIDKNYPKTNVRWQDHILPEFHQTVIEQASKAIKQHTKFTASYRIKPYRGEKECWVNTIGEYNYNENGRAIAMFGTMQDVTENKTLEIELQHSYKIAREQNNRLLNFSYIVSHNLRMHTVNIQGLLNLLDEAETEAEKAELTRFLRVSSSQLDETLHQLNEVVAMKNSLNVIVSPVPLRKAVDQAINLLKTNITDKKAIIHNLVTEETIVNYNAGYLDSILLNFLSNAIKYSHPQRQPVISISCNREQPEVHNSRWILEITDNGLGIDLEKNGEKLFGMYKTFHGNRDAKGIGLFMTKYQVEAMDGSIEVESTVDKGTTFKIYIK